MFSETKTVWQYLRQVKKPIVMYGMGDGAEKILAVMEQYGIRPAEFMASDEFVRGHSFRGYQVKKLSQIEEEYGDFLVVVCFGTSRPEVIGQLEQLAERHEVLVPDVPVYGEGLFDEKYIAENIKKIVQVRELFTDELSKYIFDQYINFKISGKFQLLSTFTTPQEEAHHLLELKKDGSEILLDLGAYNGDTVEQFLQLTDRNFKKIVAVEPDTRNFMKLRRRNYQYSSDKLLAINAAVWSEDTTLNFSDKGGRNSSLSGTRRTRPIEARSIDSLCSDLKPTLIKMDVEGSEYEALSGGQVTIKKHKPKLVVSLYHRTEDLIELPLLVDKLSVGRYKMFLRHHPYIPAWDTNLYCI